MRLLDTYALSTGSKIDKPFVYTSYFPLPCDKFIILQSNSKFNSKNYDLFQDVINILYPILEKHGMKIVQVGGQNESSYQYVIDLKGKTNIAQLSYLISRSQLVISPDSLSVHIASSFDVPICSLYSCSPSSISGPHFGSKEKQILFDAYKRVKNGKPSYAAEESPKSINRVMPEELANAVFKLLNIDFKVLFETVFVGDKYSHNILRELVPNVNLNLNNPNFPIEVRMDLHFDEKILAQQLQISKCAIITNKPVNLDLLRQFKANIAAVVYVIEENDEPDFIKKLKSLGVPMLLISYLTPEQVQAKKINYYEIGRINIVEKPPQEVIDKLKADLPNLYFKSNKILASNGQFFMTNAALVSNQPITSDFDYIKVMDNPEFWGADMNFMTMVKKI